MLSALIMAGGRGTRFYPLSTDDHPKQFLNLIGEKTMIQMTVDRLLKIMPMERIFVATGAKYVDLTKEQLPDLPEANIIVEPVGRNTAPCVVFGAMQVNSLFPSANLVVLPSDALIQDVEEFCNVLQAGDAFLNNHNEAVVTIGIEPTRPETGYGYIKQTDQMEVVNNYQIKKVERFVEKPDLDTAKEYLAQGGYFWNAGIFMWNVNYVEKLAQTYMEDTYNKLKQIGMVGSDGYEQRLFELYPLCESISVDYALMEKIDTINVIPGSFGWDDVGTWAALERYLPQDANGNITKGRFYVDNARNNIIFSTKKEVVFLGMENAFCIEADDMIVVGTRDQLSAVHELRNR